jgi:hypothetical protein
MALTPVYSSINEPKAANRVKLILKLVRYTYHAFVFRFKEKYFC